MNILVQLSHPAHFHYYRLSIQNLQKAGHNVYVLIKSKDVLEQLLQEDDIHYYNILTSSHRKSKLGLLFDMMVRDWKILVFCIKNKIDILTGSTPEVAHIGWLLRKPSINAGEDDAAIIPLYVKTTNPFLEIRLSPTTTNNGPMENKTIHYYGFQELSYLHPNHFTPNKQIVEKYGIDLSKPYFIIRFAQLNAHHDVGIKGINTDIAQRIVDLLSPLGRVLITSERELEPQFEPYRIKINPLDMHHVMAFATLYIGDSQTMAAEAGVLGVPFIRYNGFVGRIGYLDELERKYRLGFGVRPEKEPIDGLTFPVEYWGADEIYRIIDKLLLLPNIKEEFDKKRRKMLSDKIDCAKFLTWFIENYPESKQLSVNADTVFWQQFK